MDRVFFFFFVQKCPEQPLSVSSQPLLVGPQPLSVGHHLPSVGSETSSTGGADVSSWTRFPSFFVEVQRGIARPLYVRASRRPGYGQGAFAGAFLEKGGLISEYVGELISEAECTRRCPIYSHVVGHNYMAQLTSNVVVDAFRMGNVARFINHDPDNPNCESRLVCLRRRARAPCGSSSRVPQ